MVRFKTGMALCLLTLMSAWSASPAAAVIIDSGGNQELAVEYWAGTGSNASYLVVDLSAAGGGSYAFGYRWDGVTSGIQMIQDIDAAGDLDVTTVTFGTVAPTDPNFGGDPNIFIDNFFYNGEMGDASLFWAYTLGSVNDPTIDWTGATTGPSQRLLVDGGFDGWYNGFNTDFSPIAPQALPLQDVDDDSGDGGGGSAVPEPASMGLVLAGAVMLLSRRQRREA